MTVGQSSMTGQRFVLPLEDLLCFSRTPLLRLERTSCNALMSMAMNRNLCPFDLIAVARLNGVIKIFALGLATLIMVAMKLISAIDICGRILEQEEERYY